MTLCVSVGRGLRGVRRLQLPRRRHARRRVEDRSDEERGLRARLDGAP